MDDCPIDPDDELLPYRRETFDVVRRLRARILSVSRKLGVPPVAVAGSIADEYNIMHTAWGGLRRFLDAFLDASFKHHLSESIFEWSVQRGSPSKLFNATRHDIGDGNLNVATSREVYDEFRGCWIDDPIDMREFVGRDRARWRELVDFVLTDEGTVVVAALVIKKAMHELAPYLRGRSPEIQEALLVTYYKQGPERFLGRFTARLAKDPAATLTPGEGCRVYHQRAAFLRALGLGPEVTELPPRQTVEPLAPSCW